MTTRKGKADLTSNTLVAGSESMAGGTGVSVTELESIVQKAVSAAVSAAVSVIREEFRKLMDEISDRMTLAENRLDDLEARVNGLPVSNNSPDADTISEMALIKKETRECRISTNDNEQFSRRCNVRIRGLTMSNGTDCRQVVADFCRTKLHLDNIDASVVEEAHPVPNRPSRSAVGDPTNSTAPTTEPSVIVKFCRRELRDAVISKRKALKGTRFSILEDLTNLNVMTLNRVRNDDRVQSCWSWNGRIFAMLKTGVKILVKPFEPIDECQRI